MNSHFYSVGKLTLQQVLRSHGAYPILIEGFGEPMYVMCSGTALMGVRRIQAHIRRALRNSLHQRMPLWN